MPEQIQGFQLAPQQQRLWGLQWNSAVYHAVCAIILNGDLRTESLRKALHNVVNRHQILRTTFYRSPGMKVAFQVVMEDGTPVWSEVDLRNLNQQEQVSRLDSLFAEEQHHPFALEYGPQCRATLLIMAPDKHVLLIAMPAICADLWTLNNLIQELSQVYGTYTLGGELPNDAVQYLQFAEWQNELLKDEDAEAGVAYWKKQNIASPSALTLPFEQRPGNQSSLELQVHTLQIPASLASKIEVAAQQNGSSTQIFILSCWQILLWRLTGQSDIIIGYGCDGRTYEELHGAFGLFTKWIPIHCHFDQNIQFSDILRFLNGTVQDSYDWQDYFILDESYNTYQGNIHPSYYAIGFDYERWISNSCVGGVLFTVYRQYNYTEPFKIRLSCVQTESSLFMEFHYDSQLFLPQDIDRLSEQFALLTEHAANTPNIRIGDLNILSPEELCQLLLRLNDTAINYPHDACVHHLLERQVSDSPDKIAVTIEDRHVTYDELNRRANQLAHYLRLLDVGPDIIVGLYMERSFDLIIGLLGILKADGAYLPLDLTIPSERVAFILQDARASVLLTQERFRAQHSGHGISVVCLDTEWERVNCGSDATPSTIAQSDHLAYVIYTSGSSGQPKGVLIPHRGLVNYLSWCTYAYAVEGGCGAPVHSPIDFDLTITSLFSPLLVGQRVLLLPEDQGIDKLKIALLTNDDLSLVKLTPSHLEILNQQLAPTQIPRRARALIIGGEVLKREHVAVWHTYAPNTRLINEYGPTETVVGCCVYEVPEGSEVFGVIPIGRPIANTQIYIVDANLQLVPIGVPGELHIGGAGLARGYLNRPDLTAEKFIPNPFSEEAGARLYKTGDLARYLPDGTIEFLGRIDYQVKIRGFRIELGEIESILTQHSAVRESVVLARADERGYKRLVAYIVPDVHPAPTISDLHTFLKAKLPDYMLPAAFVVLQALPLTPNGKVDRQALPAPDQARPDLSDAFVAPRTPTEEILAGIWTQVLGVERLGVHDSFFELGGDSILSIQVIARANQQGLRLTPKQLFEHQTIADLAAVAGQALAAQSEQGLVSGPAPLTPIQQWFFEQALPEPHHWNMALLLELRQPLIPSLIHQAVEHLLLHHDALRLRFIQEDSQWRQIYAAPSDVVPFSVVDLSALPDSEQFSALEARAAELQASLDLSEGRLVRVTVFDRGPTKSSRLLLVMHHLVVDGISWRILLEDLQTIYRQLVRGEAVRLPPKTTSLKYWAERLTDYGQSSALQEELTYWLALSESPGYSLPMDSTVGPNTEASACTFTHALSREETQTLLQEVPAVYHTLINDVLLTALLQAFAWWTGVPLLFCDLEGHGREEIEERIDLTRTVGWFTSRFPVLLTAEKAATPIEALKAVKEQLRRLPNHGIGYGILYYLTKEASIAEKLRMLPRAEVSFNYLGQLDQVFAEATQFGPAYEAIGSTRSLRGTRPYLLDINASILDGQLKLAWTYSTNRHHYSTIEAVGHTFMEVLQSLIAYAQSSAVASLSIADFPMAELDEQELIKLAALINRINAEES